MNRPAVKIGVLIGALGAICSLATLLVAGPFPGLSAAIGAVIALINYILFGWVTSRVTNGSLRRRAGLMLLLVAKMGALMVLIYYLITRHLVQPLAFMVGVSALVVGVVFGSLVFINSGSQTAGREI
jgi:hypothetical protein